ncbi:MAG: hypothetical protein H0V62_15380 [Gammaproteobacteria bacterium]|nr:hypothetical protein [Gammaproteobacteria bacterium]
MDIDYIAVRFWLDLLQLIGIVVIGIYAWWQGRSRATTAAIDRVETHGRQAREQQDVRLREHNDRVLRLEEQIGHLPGRNESDMLSTRIGEINARVAEVAAEAKATNHLLAVVHQHLLERVNNARVIS